VEALPGIPTIRVFEALACGIPLVSAPWRDEEGLFAPGEYFLVAGDGAEMTRHLKALRHDAAMAQGLRDNGLARILARHSCAHRVDELLNVLVKRGTSRVRTALEAAAPQTAPLALQDGVA
jgi:spore maturation protein CgeB